VDLYETFRALAGAPAPPQVLDGVNLLPVLQKGDKELGEHDLFWYLPFYSSFNRPCVVVRRGKWKFIYLIEMEKGEMYNTETDIGETTDLSADFPLLEKDLTQAALQWLDDTEAPRMVPNPDYQPEKEAY
jgi:arylsulfatase A-like enzyme